MNNRTYELQREKSLTAICIIPETSAMPGKALKFRNIVNKLAPIAKFEKYVRVTHTGVTHINYYGTDSKRFYYQQKLNE